MENVGFFMTHAFRIELPECMHKKTAKINIAYRMPEKRRRWCARRTSGLKQKKKKEEIEIKKKTLLSFQNCSYSVCSPSWILNLYLLQLLNWMVLSLIVISGSNRSNLMQYDLINGLYRFILFLLILLFWHWPNSLHCIIQCVKELRIHSVGT